MPELETGILLCWASISPLSLPLFEISFQLAICLHFQQQKTWIAHWREIQQHARMLTRWQCKIRNQLCQLPTGVWNCLSLSKHARVMHVGHESVVGMAATSRTRTILLSIMSMRQAYCAMEFSSFSSVGWHARRRKWRKKATFSSFFAEYGGI